MRQWWQRRSLRLRLTFWYAITSTVILLALGGLMFLVVRGRLLSQLDRQLRGDFEMIESRVVRPNPYDELGQLATVFNATLARLENSFGELRRFTADASHELRTPLTALRAVGEAALRSEAEDTKGLREALLSMLEEARRLGDVVDALLLLARADTGGLSPSLQQVDLAGLLNEVRETLLVLAEEKS